MCHSTTIKLQVFLRFKTHVFYHRKVRAGLSTSVPLRIKIAIYAPNINFSSVFTMVGARQKTTVKHDGFESPRDHVTNPRFLAISIGKKHSPPPCDWLAGWWWVGWLGWAGWAGWLAGWLVGWLAGWLVGWLAGWLAGWLVGWYGIG